MFKTVCEMMTHTAKTYAGQDAVKFKKGSAWQGLTWAEYLTQVQHVARGFIALGLDVGQVVTILGKNRTEWLLADLGAIFAGGVPAGIYATSSSDQCAYIINHSQAAAVICEDLEQLKKIQAVRKDLPSLKFLVLMSGEDPTGEAKSWKELMQLGQSNKALNEIQKRREDALQAGDLATLVYTSGTTSNPKAVMISHQNLIWMAKVCCHDEFALSPSDRLISYLPLSHIAEQMLSLHGPIYGGASVWFAESVDKLPQAMQEVRPTIFFGVPRVWEKIQEKMQSKGREASSTKKFIAGLAKKVGYAHNQSLQAKGSGHILYPLFRSLVFSKVKDALGLDQCRLAVTAAAPIARETLDFFLSLDITLCEVYGMSESTGPTTMSRNDMVKTGTVGRPMTGSEVKLDEDGEILFRGPHIFMGYLHDEAATRETIDPEGWLHSGDIGSFDADGFLSITGRKKNIIITSGGKNIAPEMMENKLGTIEGIEHAVVVGDNRNYLVSLLTLSEGSLAKAKSLGSPAKNLQDVSHCPLFSRYVQNELETINESVARVQSVKKFCLLSNGFREDAGELTPTLKVKRNVVLKKYQAEIDRLYS